MSRFRFGSEVEANLARRSLPLWVKKRHCRVIGTCLLYRNSSQGMLPPNASYEELERALFGDENDT